MLAPYIEQIANDSYLKSIATKELFKRYPATGTAPSMNDECWHTISIQIRAFGLATLDRSKTIKGGVGWFWALTPSGRRLMFELIAVKKDDI